MYFCFVASQLSVLLIQPKEIKSQILASLWVVILQDISDPRQSCIFCFPGVIFIH